MRPSLIEIRSIYADIESVTGITYDPQGWNSRPPMMERFIREVRPKVIVHVGVWKGNALLYMAGICRQLGLDTLHYGVDVFRGLSGEMVSDMPDSQIPRHWNRPTLYQQFLFNVKHDGLDDCVIPVQNFTRWGAKMLAHWGVRAGLIYVDGGHDEEFAFMDIGDYWPILEVGGRMFGDDLQPAFPGVERAVRRSFPITGREWHAESGHWYFDPK